MTLIFDATNAYLGPLLEKHTAGQPLVWEDLLASQAACSAVLRQSNNTFVSSRMDKLHQSQVKAYREAAIQSVKEWASSLPLQPMEEGDTKITFVNRCIVSINTAVEAMPNWKLDNAKVTAMNEIRKRAVATFEKYHPAEEENGDKEDETAPIVTAAMSEDVGTEDEAGEESEGGEVSESGEITGDDDNESDQEQTTSKTTHPNRKKNRLAAVKKNMAMKKGTRTKPGYRNTKGGRGARRGGRGGGRGSQK